MRIGFFTDGYLPQPNGVATSVYETVRELEKLGHEVVVVAPRFPGYVDRGQNVIRLASFKLVKQPETRLAMHLPDKHLRRVMAMDFDIIHGHSGGPVTLIGWEIARAKNIPFVVTYHTLWNRYTHYFLKGKIIRPKMIEVATKLIGNRVDRLIAPTRRVEKELRKYGVKKPISVVPSGIDVDRFAQAPEGYLRRKIKVESDPIILFVGRLGREKSIDFLLKAFAVVLKEMPTAHFAIVGEGVDRKKLESLSRRLKISASTHFVGGIKNEDMYKVYRDASAFVFASNTETQGLVVPEALSSGVPVVAVDDPAFECIENNKNGYLVKRDVQEFALKTLSLLKNPELAREMSENAKVSAQKFSVKTTAGALDDIYYKLLDENNKLSVKRIMDENKRGEQFFVFQFVFWATILLSRLFVFLFHVGSMYPGVVLAGTYFTLPSVGAFLMLLSIALTLPKKSIEFIPLLLFGVGAGFIGGDLWGLVAGGKNIADYWYPASLVPLVLAGLLPFVFVRKAASSPKFFINTRQQFHENPKNPRVSVVIPAYNEAGFIETMLKSILTQSYKDFELIVVDNNSTDNTGEVAKKFGARVILQKEKGVAWARQAGFMAAKGEIVMCTDSDAVVPENWVERMVEAFDRDRKLVAFGGLGFLYSGPADARAAGRYLFPLFWIMDRYLSGGWNLNGFNLGVRRDAFIKIGGFRTNMTMGEDIDLAKRLREVGKVSVDTKFSVNVSGRRYKDGLFSGVATYAPSYVMRVLFKKDEFLTFNPVRSEKTTKSANLLPVTILLLFLTALFYLA